MIHEWVITITLVPLAIGTDFSINRIVRSINYVPLVTVMDNVSQIGIAYGGDALFMIRLIARNVGGNILLLLPLGFLAPILWEKFRRFSRIVILGLVVSCSIEILQLVENLIGWFGRISDIDDVIFNVIGAMIGYTLYKITSTIANSIKSKSVSSMSNYGV